MEIFWKFSLKFGNLVPKFPNFTHVLCMYIVELPMSLLVIADQLQLKLD